MTYTELKQSFCELKRENPAENLTAHIIFTEDSFTKQYSLLSRTYRIASDEKVFWPNIAGYSIFGDCLDGTDQRVRLDYCMEDERANIGGWKVQECYILERMQDADIIPSVHRKWQKDGSLVYSFGDTIIRANETMFCGNLYLDPVAGKQLACGKWTDLPVDKLHGYCFLLEKYLNGGENG